MPHKLPFRVVHATSQDENNPVIELNQHSPSTKGWISARFCIFPQVIVLALESKARLRKIQILCHQYLIASKIEFFIGDTPEDELRHFKNAKYTRLGYVALSDNVKTEFKARELKSVHIDASGSFIQIFLHKNHKNKLNKYNQVGIVAINLIGDSKNKLDLMEDDSLLSIHKPDYIPPTEDLAFDMYQDPEVANIIRRLDRQKHIAVLNEQFDRAQHIRDTIAKLREIGERLGRLALEKQNAVEEEDYARAKLKKYQMDEIRTNMYRDMDLDHLLSDESVEQFNRRENQDIDQQQALVHVEKLPTNQVRDSSLAFEEPPTQPIESVNHFHEIHDFPYHDYQLDLNPDERPLPTLQNRVSNNSAVPSSLADEFGDVAVCNEISCADPPLATIYEHSVAVAEPSVMDDFEDQETMHVFQHGEPQEAVDNDIEQLPGDLSDLPEPMSEANRRQAHVAIDIVGLNLVTKAYSKSWVFREKALLELECRVTAPQLPAPTGVPESFGPDPRSELKSTTFLLRRALHDQVLSIFRLATKFMKSTLVDFADKYAIPRQELYNCLDKLIPVLFQRTGDTSIRIRDIAKAQILDMAKWPQMKQCTALWHEFLRPLSPVTLDRLALSRIELVTDLYATRGVDHGVIEHGHLSHPGFTLDAVANFTARALMHRSNEVRNAAENLMVALYRAEDRNVIRRLMPDDINSRHQPLYRRLSSKFQQIDKKSPRHGTSPEANLRAQKKQELEALQADVQQLRAIAGHNSRSHESRRSNTKKSTLPSPAPITRSRIQTTKSNSRSKSNPKEKNRGSSKSLSPAKYADKHPPSKIPQYQPSDSTSQMVGDAELLLTLDKICIFCGEQNDNFTEEGLDAHYWRNCPMLHRCPECKQVVEVAGLVDHLLTECECAETGLYARCPQCTEAVLRSHLKSHNCRPMCGSSGLRCPLCHCDLPSLPDSIAPGGHEDIWKAHLLGTNFADMPQCSRNPRNSKANRKNLQTVSNDKKNKNQSNVHASSNNNQLPKNMKSGIPRFSTPAKVQESSK